jgi:hypothetical protein
MSSRLTIYDFMTLCSRLRKPDVLYQPIGSKDEHTGRQAGRADAA